MSLPPAGWYPDPAGGPGQRWWDGQAWAPSPAAVPAEVPQSYPPAIGTLPPPAPDFGGPTYPPVASWPQGVGPGRQRSRSGNHYALVTFAFVAVYLVLAIVVHFAILGIVPAVYAWRSRQAREPLAPVAIIAAVVSIIVGVGAFVH